MDERNTPPPEQLLAERRWLQRIARGLVGESEADDVAQEAWSAARRHPPGSLRPGWFLRVVRNLAGERRRKAARRAERERRAARPEAQPSHEELLQHMELQRIVAEEVTRLPEPWRATVLMRFVEDLSPQEIARRTDTPAGTVRRRLKEALDRLRERLDRRAGGDRGAWTSAVVSLLAAGERARARTLLWAGSLGAVLVAAGIVAVAALADQRPRGSALLASAATPTPAAADRAPGAELGSPDASASDRAAVPTGGDVVWVAGVVARATCSPLEPLAVVSLPAAASWAELVRARDPRSLERHEVDADGRFRLPAPRGARLHLALAGEVSFLSRSVSVVAGEEGDALLLSAEEGVRVIGVLASPGGAPLVGAELQLVVDRSSASGPELRPEDVWRAAARTDGKGAFAFPPAPAGRELVLLAAPPLGSAAGGERFALPAAAGCGEYLLESELSPPDRIAGSVVDEAGRPVAGARVLCRLAGDPSDVPLLLRETETGPDGRYALEGVAASKVLVRAEKGGYRTGRELSVSPRDGGVSPRDDLALELRTGPGFVVGTVVDEDGLPVAGATVVVRSERFDAARYAPRAEVLTDAGGAFRIDPAAGGELRVRASGTSRGAPAACEVRGVRAGTALALSLRPLESLVGRVVAPDGAAVQDFAILLARPEDPGAPSERFAFADGAGRFELAGLDPGPRLLRAVSASSSSARRLVEPPAADLVLVLGPWATVAGLVVDRGGEPVPGCGLALSEAGGGEGVRGSSRADGTFELAGVPPGAYELRPLDDSGRPAGAALALEVAPGEVLADVRVEVAAAGVLVGRVIARGGAPLRSVPVAVRSVETGESRAARTDAEGVFRAEDLAPGLWTVSVPFVEGDTIATASAGETFVAPPGTARVHQVTRAADIVAGGVAELVFREREDGQSLVRGTVSRGGRPLPGRQLAFFRSGVGSPADILSTTTDGEGRFEVRLPPDTYLVRAMSTVDPEEVVLACTVTGAAEQELRLDGPAGELLGRVARADGTPAPGVRVRLDCPASVADGALRPERDVQVVSDAEGRFALRGLGPGSYRLWVGGAGASGPSAARLALGPIELGRDEVIEGLELPLREPDGAVDVVVLDAAGAPVEGASVLVRDEHGGIVEPIVPLTDPGGRARVPCLAAGRYLVSARDGAAASDATSVLVSRGAAVHEVELVLRPATLLVVEHLDERGLPAAAAFDVRDASGRRVDGAASRSEYRARLVLGGASPTGLIAGPLVPGRYEITARDVAGQEIAYSVQLDGERERRVVLRLDP